MHGTLRWRESYLQNFTEGQEEKGATEDEMVGWHRPLDGRDFEQTLGDGEGQGSLACCSPWGYRVRHDLATEQ